jgi:transcriptional regulator with GAF, ATPase, and Fis domain
MNQQADDWKGEGLIRVAPQISRFERQERAERGARHRRKLEERRKIVKKVAKPGMSIAQVAKAVGAPQSTIRHDMIALGIPFSHSSKAGEGVQ